MSKQIMYVSAVVVFVAAIMVVAMCGPEARSRQQAGTISGRAVDGLLSSGMVTSIEWGEPIIVTVPDSWMDLQPTARRNYLMAIFQAAPVTTDVRVVNADGELVEVFTLSQP